jgi:hypothetical protein
MAFKGKKWQFQHNCLKLNSGTVLKDTYKEDWILGSPIGKGGFGIIYRGY